MTGLTINEDAFGAAPMQATGTLPDGRAFYFRARHRSIRLEVAEAGHDFSRSEGDRGIALQLVGFDDDRHPLSCFDERHVRPLIEFLADVLANAEEWESRRPS